MKQNQIEELSIATIRSLCIDQIQKAKSGHPGMALGSAPILYTLFTKHLVVNPDDPNWINRDRFVLSSGHASSLLYALLHLSGYKISMDDLKAFRTLGSITPGHPEVDVTPGVDASSGPLGQGLAQAVGLALAERTLANMYEDGEKLINHYTYCLCGDGCIEEGISLEAMEFAGTQKLNKLIVFYDKNNVTLDGSLDLSSQVDFKKRFEGALWNVLEVEDGNDCAAINNAIEKAKKSDKPTIIIVTTIIGFGSKNQGTNKTHGAPLDAEDGKSTKVNVYHFDHEDFYVPEEVYKHFKDTIYDRGLKSYNHYNKVLDKYKESNKLAYERFINSLSNDVSRYVPEVLPDFDSSLNEPTRKTSSKALNTYALTINNLIGGSADVASSVMTKLNGFDDITSKTPAGRNINYGIRELAMCSIQNGILLHKGLRSFAGSFFVFSDYLKPAIRMASISKLPAIYLFSHDSIAVGQDGPTHEPIEQLATLRSTPNLIVFRPCDARETYVAYQIALRSLKTPVAIVTSRQNVKIQPSNANAFKGGYVIGKENKKIDYTLIAAGSEVGLCLDAKAKLLEKGIDVRVVSLPSFELFDQQDEEYKESVYGVDYNKRISVEMGSTFGWAKYAKHNKGIDSFGLSGPAEDVIKEFKFTVDDIVDYVLNIK